MLITNLDVDKIVLTNVDSKTSIIELKVMFTNETPLKFTLQLEDDFNLLILKLIKRIKSLKIPQETDEDEIDTTSANEDEELKEDITQKEQPTDDQDSTKGFIPFLIGFAVGIMVTAGFSVLIKS